MPTTRRSARLASSQDSSSPVKGDSPVATTGSKRKSETGSSPAPKRGKKDASKEQKTIEETMDIDQPEPPTPKGDIEQSESKSEQPSSDNAPTESAAQSEIVEDDQNKGSKVPAKQPEHSQPESHGSTKADTENKSSHAASAETQAKADEPTQSGQQDQKRSEEDEKSTSNASAPAAKEEPVQDQPAQKASEANDKEDKDQVAEQSSTQDPAAKSQSGTDAQADGGSTAQASTNGTAIEAHARDDETPSSIMEKGIIYFFFRGRVGIDNPSDVQDIARSYIVLRPLPHGAKLGDGPIGESTNKCRLLALPKKVLPTSGKDRFMTFVEKTHTSFPELKKSFLPADDYETQTAGVRHTPPATPIAEGVYAITTTGRENHLAYMLTIPSSLGQVQQDMGLREQGSFVVSCKNPQFPGPSYASLPQSPDFPKEVLDEFRSLRWLPLQPKHLDYENTQFLLIGESSGIEKALDVPDDQKDQKEDTAKEEMERLEGEDEIRVKHLKGDDAIFADLGVSKKDYPQVPSTWGN